MKEHMVYKRLGAIDLPYLKALIRVYEEVFEMENLSLPPESYLQSLLRREGLMFFVATLDGNLVGGLTAYVLPSVYFESAEVYIYDLGVKTSYQRKGIGRKLLATLSEYCKEQGYKEIFVQADLVDQHALDFYQATGGQAERVVHYVYSLA